jgi:hypothetical protein
MGTGGSIVYPQACLPGGDVYMLYIYCTTMLPCVQVRLMSGGIDPDAYYDIHEFPIPDSDVSEA